MYIGMTFCAYLFDQGGNTLAKSYQNGFFSLNGEPRTKLIEAVTEINGQWAEEASQPENAAGLKALDETLWETWDQYLVKPHRDAAVKGGAKSKSKGGK